jgi:hypothetical protein
VPSLASNVYVVVVAGVITGFEIAGLLTPVVGVQAKEVPFVVTIGVKELPKQILVPLIAPNESVLVNVMVTAVVAVQVVTGFRVTTL